MRCLSCNEAMKPYDRTRKTLSGEYIDLCFPCYRTIAKELPSVGNPALFHEDDEETTAFDSALDSGDDPCYHRNYIDDEGNDVF